MCGNMCIRSRSKHWFEISAVDMLCLFYGFEWTLPSFHWFSMIKQFSVREYVLYRDLYMMFLLCCSISIKWNEPLGKCKCVLFSFGKRMPLAVQIYCFHVYVPVGVWDCCSILSVIKDLGRSVTSRMWGKIFLLQLIG